MTKYFKVIAAHLLLLGLFSQPAYADKLSQLTQAITEKTSASETLPSPQDLKPKWWEYFANTDEKNLSGLIKEAEQNYRSLLISLSAEEAEEADYQLTRFLQNLKKLQELRKSPTSPKDWEIKKPQQFYSIDEWLSIADQLRKQNLEVEEKKVRLAMESKAIKVSDKSLDLLKLAYIKLTNPQQRLVLGLEIMAESSDIETSNMQLHLEQVLLNQYQEYLENLTVLHKTASQSLKTDENFLAKLEKEQQDLNKQLLKAQVKVRKLNTPVLLENTPLSLSLVRLNKQERLNATLEEAGLELQLHVLDAKKALAMMLLNFENLANLRKTLLDWKIQVSENQQNIQAWSKDTAEELSQAQDQIITQEAESAENATLTRTLKQRVSVAQSCLVKLKQMEIDLYALQNLLQKIEGQITQQSSKIDSFDAWAANHYDILKKSLTRWSSEPLFKIGDTPVTATGVLQIVIIIVLTILTSKLLRKLMQRLVQRNIKSIRVNYNPSAFYTIGRLTHYIILLIGIVIALTSIGLDLTNLALVAGALTVGIGFGLQSIVNNFISGLILLFEGSIKIGDVVELESGLQGVVKEINVRSTQIKNVTDNIDVIVPNSILVTHTVINWTLEESYRRIHVPFRVAYGSDKETVKKAVLEAAAKVPYTYKPDDMDAARCWLVRFADNGLEFELVVWIAWEAVSRPAMVHAMYLWEIETSLSQHGVEIPLPQRDIRIRDFK